MLDRLVPATEPEQAAAGAQIISHPRFQPAPLAVQPDAILRLEQLGGQAFVRDVATDFIAEARGSLLGMATAAAKGDSRAYRACAHAMASGAANVGAQPLQALCRAAQNCRGAELPLQAPVDLEAIGSELERVVAALQASAGPVQRQG
jgi:HPt (histidine-containing phosphotransfer) domain-containing protein